MKKDKIHIDQFFKTALQNLEGMADEEMFEAIKSKADLSKISVDHYFKNAIAGVEIDADDFSFDSLKKEIDATKVSVDTYFKEALLDYNAVAGHIPFLEIQNKLDREKVIDHYFKNALQNYVSQAQMEEFAVIRSRVVQLQQIESRKRYAWLLLLLLIPVSFIGYKYGNRVTISSNHIIANATTEDDQATAKKPSAEAENKSNQDMMGRVNGNPAIVSTNNIGTDHKLKSQGKRNVITLDLSDTMVYDVRVLTDKVVFTDDSNPNKVSTDSAVEHVVMAKVTDSMSIVSTDRSLYEPLIKPDAVTIRKHKQQYNIEVFGAAALNSRYLHTDNNSAAYFATRSASDKQTTKYNFGLDLFKNIGKLNLGVGLHESQFGQKGIYQINKQLFDSVPYIDINLDTSYFYIQRDTAYRYRYNNNFTSFELPLHFSYIVSSTQKWNFETGISMLLSYITNVKGALPNATSSDVVLLKNSMNTINKWGSALTVNMKFHYLLTDHWQLGTDIYLKSNITSLYKKETGISELPYSFGWRWGIGFKF